MMLCEDETDYSLGFHVSQIPLSLISQKVH